MKGGSEVLDEITSAPQKCRLHSEASSAIPMLDEARLLAETVSAPQVITDSIIRILSFATP